MRFMTGSGGAGCAWGSLERYPAIPAVLLSRMGRGFGEKLDIHISGSHYTLRNAMNINEASDPHDTVLRFVTTIMEDAAKRLLSDHVMCIIYD